MINKKNNFEVARMSVRLIVSRFILVCLVTLLSVTCQYQHVKYKLSRKESKTSKPLLSLPYSYNNSFLNMYISLSSMYVFSKNPMRDVDFENN